MVDLMVTMLTFFFVLLILPILPNRSINMFLTLTFRNLTHNMISHLQTFSFNQILLLPQIFNNLSMCKRKPSLIITIRKSSLLNFLIDSHINLPSLTFIKISCSVQQLVRFLCFSLQKPFIVVITIGL